MGKLRYKLQTTECGDFGAVLPQLMQWYLQALGEWRPKYKEYYFYIKYLYLDGRITVGRNEHGGGFGFVFPEEEQAGKFIKDHKTLLEKFYTLIKL